MLQGLVKCSACGRTLSPTGANGMQCVGYVHGTCGVSHYISTGKLTALVLAALDADLSGKEVSIIKKAPREPSGDVEILEKQILRERRKLARCREAYEAGVDTLDEYKEYKSRIMQRIAALENLRTEPDKRQAGHSAERCCGGQRGELAQLQSPKLSEADKNILLRTFVERIIFDRAAMRVEIVYYR